MLSKSILIMIYELNWILKSCQKNNWWMVTKPRSIQVQHLLLWLRLLRVPQLCNCMCRLLPITQVATSRRFTQAHSSKRLSQRFLYFCCFPFLFKKKCCERHYQCSLIKSFKHYIVFFSQIPALPLLWVWIPGKASRFEKENGKLLPISSPSPLSSSSSSSLGQSRPTGGKA